MTQPYTNIAAAYGTGPGAKADFNLDSWNRFSADHPSISNQQFKVMTQQLKAWNPTFASSGKDYANAKLRGAHFSGVPGMYSPKNPLGAFQGGHGNFGAKSFTDAYNAGAFQGIDPGTIPSLVQQGGMMMPHGSTQMWQNMMYGQQQQSRWEQMMANIPTAEDIMAMMPQYQAPEPVGHGQAYSTAGSMMSGLQTAQGDKFDTEGGGSSTAHQFGQGQQYVGQMNIGGNQPGHGDVKTSAGGTDAAVFGAEQNTKQMEWNKLLKKYDWKTLNTAGSAGANAAAALGINIA